MVDPAPGIEARHAVHDRPVGIGCRAHDELHRHARHAARLATIARTTGTFLRPIRNDHPTRALERHEGVLCSTLSGAT
jgi:hypothetical protein